MTKKFFTAEFQPDLFETVATRSALDQLLEDSRLYRTTSDYKALLDFVSGMRDFAPFNAMLLQIQKPGLRFAATAHDWKARFERTIKADSRPLLIMWPFGPVALVYDVVDTAGKPIPDDAFSFPTKGEIANGEIERFIQLLAKHCVLTTQVDTGDMSAGSIRSLSWTTGEKPARTYALKINRNHPSATQFVTLAHELAHLFLGHLGSDKALGIPQRQSTELHVREIEAESVAYLLCSRNGVVPKSESYLNSFLDANTTVDRIDIYQIMRATGHIEAMLELGPHKKQDRPRASQRST